MRAVPRERDLEAAKGMGKLWPLDVISGFFLSVDGFKGVVSKL